MFLMATMRTNLRLLCWVTAVAVSGLPTGAAHAQSAADKATAEQLFKEARGLMTAKKFDEACAKLEASLRLDAALGTRLNLANCYEELGKLASAWGMYHEAEDLAANENQPKRVKFAQDHAKALEPRLPRLVISVPEAAKVPGLKVTRDGTVIDAAVFGTSIYVDPGKRTIVAAAPGHLSFTTEATAVEAKEIKVEIPVLEAAPTPAPAVGGGGAGDTGGTASPAVTVEYVDRGRGRRLLGLGVGGGGIVAVAVGLGFGLSAKSKWDKAIDSMLCSKSTKMCTPAGQALADSARRRATVATVAVSAGAALVVTGAVLYFTAPRKERRSARLLPAASADSVGVAWVGSF
jgi:tetratricopeptide (TPR) repeat protein